MQFVLEGRGKPIIPHYVYLINKVVTIQKLLARRGVKEKVTLQHYYSNLETASGMSQSKARYGVRK